ncbi:MAG: DUF1932 domain-containing protein [Pseudomonadales bacterium]
MNQQRLGFLHPGAMGIYLASTVVNSDHKAYWVSEGRSQRTRDRATKYSLLETPTLSELCEICTTIFSICPPDSALEVAKQVLACGFEGTYVDANAVSPQRVQEIAAPMVEAGVNFVDGGIIGLPLRDSDTTWLYLSGSHANDVAACFTAGPLRVDVIGETIGKASALKMCYAAKTKGTTALLCALEAAAEELGVRTELENQWRRENAESVEHVVAAIRQATAKAWRFSGEMKEIAATFENAGLPGDFYYAAAELYRRMAHFKGEEELPEIVEVLAALVHKNKSVQAK